jgi:hypothetical protein
LNKLTTLVAGVLALIGSSGAQAASMSWYMDQSNALADGVNYLQVTISDASFGLDPNAIRFDVTLLTPLTSIAGGNFGIQSFGFNTTLTVATVLAGIAGLPSGWSATTTSNQDGFGNFELVNSGNGSSRQNPTLTFHVTNVAGDSPATYAVLSGGNAGEGNVFFAGHVAGFLDQDPGAEELTSAFFGGSTVVPVPAAVWLLGSALGVLGMLRRRTAG